MIFEKYRTERSAEIAVAIDITPNSASVVYYDLPLHRRYARASVVGTQMNALSVKDEVVRLVSRSMREAGIPSSAVKKVGVAAPVYAECCLEAELSPVDLYLSPDTEIFFVPYISAAISGRFTASLLTLPEGDCIAADFGGTLCAAVVRQNGIVCAAFPLAGAFDGSGLESGMPAEKGAIDAVRLESDGTIAYEVVGDVESGGISPCAAAMSVGIMLEKGILDSDGIMTDRDLFYIGEDYFVSQSDVRVIQSDKARSAAAFGLLPKSENAFFSGEIFSTGAGLRSLIGLGAVPKWCSSAAYCRNSAEQGIIFCLESNEIRQKAFDIAENAKDITEKILPEFDKKYLSCLAFSEGL